MPESAPRVEGLAAPDPDARGDADGESHEVFEHEDGVQRPGPGYAGTGQRLQPLVPQSRLVQVTRKHRTRRHCVQHREHADPDHQFLQLVSLGARLPFDHRPDAEETDESCEQETRAQEKVGEQRRQDERANPFRSDCAHSRDRIPGDSSMQEGPDCLGSWRQPGRQVEVLRVTGDGLVAPLESSC